MSGRRFGKSRYAATESIAKALNYDGEYDPITPPAVIIGAPTLKMCRRIFFKPLAKLLKSHPLVADINRSDLIIETVGNRPDIHFVGLSDVNSDRLRGFRLYHINADEAQDVSRETFDAVLLPALMDTAGSSMTVTGTPKGELNILGQLKKRCLADPENWRFHSYTTYDNPLIPKEEIDTFKKLLAPEIFEQEILAAFVKPPGQFFSCYDPIKHLYQTGSVRFEKVWLGHDYGDVNPAWAVIGWYDNCFYVEDVFDNKPNIDQELLDLWGAVNNTAMEENEQMEFFKKLCHQYKVNRIYTGHDKPSRLKTIRRIGAEFGINGMKKAVVGKPITQTATLINSLYQAGMIRVSNRCIQKGLDKDIQSYKRASDRDGNLIDEPENKSSFHRLDAIGYVIGTIGQRYNILYKNTNKPVSIPIESFNEAKNLLK